MDEKNPYVEYEEIDIREYIRVFWKRKLLLFVFLILGFAVAGIISYRTRDAVEVESAVSIIEVGKFQNEYIEFPKNLVEKIKSGMYAERLKEEFGEGIATFKVIKAENPPETSLIYLEIVASEFGKSKEISRKLVDSILEEQREAANQKRRVLGDEIYNLEKRLEFLEAGRGTIDGQSKILKDEITALELQSKDFFQKFLLSDEDKNRPLTAGFMLSLRILDELNNRKQNIVTLDLEKFSVNDRILLYSSQMIFLKERLAGIQDPKLLKQSVASELPIRNLLVFNLVIGGLAGLLIGGLVVLGKEWWRKSSNA